VKLGAD